MDKITVRAPATSANLGPGFDCFGCALSLYNEISFSPAERTEIIGCDKAFAGADNLTRRAAAAVYRRCGAAEPALRIEINAGIPIARGLGSSAAMLAAGAAAANYFCGNALGKAELLKLTTEIEGHPDNLAPAIYGGLTAAMKSGNEILTERFELSPSLFFCTVIPDFQVSTHMARQVLPESIPFSDAAAQAGRAAMLLPALCKGDETMIRSAIADVLHEPYRKKLICGFDEVKAAALELGAIAFFISGSGPTCIALTGKPDFDKKLALSGRIPDGWTIKMLTPDYGGTVITEEK